MQPTTTKRFLETRRHTIAVIDPAFVVLIVHDAILPLPSNVHEDPIHATGAPIGIVDTNVDVEPLPFDVVIDSHALLPLSFPMDALLSMQPTRWSQSCVRSTTLLSNALLEGSIISTTHPVLFGRRYLELFVFSSAKDVSTFISPASSASALLPPLLLLASYSLLPLTPLY